MTKINYTKQRLNGNLKNGIFFSIFGLVLAVIGAIFSIEIKGVPLESLGVGQIGGGIFFLIMYLHEKQKQYLTIENGSLRRNSFLSSAKVNLNEVKQMKKFGGDYILKTDKSELVIDTQVIDEKSLIALDAELEKLNLQ